MSSTPNTPGETTTTYVETAASSLPRWVTLLFVVAFALVAYLLYARPKRWPLNWTKRIRALPI
jgi:hypothetical protein